MVILEQYCRLHGHASRRLVNLAERTTTSPLFAKLSMIKNPVNTRVRSRSATTPVVFAFDPESTRKCGFVSGMISSLAAHLRGLWHTV